MMATATASAPVMPTTTAAPAAAAKATSTTPSEPVPPSRIVDVRHNQSYVRGALIGVGGFARVYLLQDSAGDTLAVKVIAKERLTVLRTKQKLTTEIKIHKSLAHENIVRFKQFFEDKEFVYIVLELCENQTLAELVKRRRRLTEPEVQYYLAQVLAAVRYMHSRSVIHRDLKLGNLFINKRLELKIGDFGLATVVTHPGERKRTICGTPNYIAPEVLNNNAGHSFEVDIWSIGVIMYTLLVGFPPFQTDDLKTTYKKIRANDYSFPPNCVLSAGAVSLIRWLMHSDPAKRPTLDQIQESEFFTKHRIPSSLPSSSMTTEPLFLSATELGTRPQRSSDRSAAPSAAPSAASLETDSRRKVLGEADTNVNELAAMLSTAVTIAAKPTVASVQNQLTPLVAEDDGTEILLDQENVPQPMPTSSRNILKAAPAAAGPVKPKLVENVRAVAPTIAALPDPLPSRSKQLPQEAFLPPAPAKQQRPVSSLLPVIEEHKPSVPAPAMASAPGMPGPAPAPALAVKSAPMPSSVPVTAHAPAKSAPMPSSVPAPAPAKSAPMPSSVFASMPPAMPAPAAKSASMPTPAPAAKPAPVPTPMPAATMAVKLAPTTALPGATSLPASQPQPPAPTAPVSLQTSPQSAANTGRHDTIVIQTLARRLNQIFDPSAAATPMPASHLTYPGSIHTWVGKWVDYTNKYGLGYQLTSGSVGVFFNDKSSLVLPMTETIVHYYELPAAQAPIRTHAVSALPVDLQKKWTLLMHFKTYMQENLMKEPVRTASSGSPPPCGGKENLQEHVRITKWFRTKVAIVFRLSHGVYQFNFFDHAKLMLSADGEVLFIDKERLPKQSFLSDLPNLDPSKPESELVSRLRYARDVLQLIVSGAATSAAQPTGQPR